jgi:hypothetical protein
VERATLLMMPPECVQLWAELSKLYWAVSPLATVTVPALAFQ